MIEFKLPSLGADMDEGTLLEWLVKPGDEVKKGQIVAIVDTSKAAVDVECWQEGTVAGLLVAPQQKVPVGTVLALLLEAGESAADADKYKCEMLAKFSELAQPAAVAPVVAAAPAPTAVPLKKSALAGRRLITPVARKRALELNLDLDIVTGSGPRGAVTLEDVEQAVTKLAQGAAAPNNKQADRQADRQAEMRKAIAAAMSRSKREIPHYYLAEPIPMARALAWLAQENIQRPMAERLLPAVLLLKAVAQALRKYPELNGFYRDGAFQQAVRVNPGVAVSLRQGGLLAPALLDADRKNLAMLMQELGNLVKRTRTGSLKSSELSEATITVTNLGDQGVESVFGVIYPPQVALVGFGRIIDKAWVEGGQVKVQPIVVASLAADHRVSDGHRGALFLAELREQLQQPEALEKISDTNQESEPP
ncbi:MAG: 2-oxo acid dehydrogenase subunit E2 [Rugosibacter sp.]|nr:MAG: 2-oxo acid dehydrogenase subunit E2 [Rugosibacter sp.]TBR10037.1 MAG: 2-oxo acid dehydrogenase subunit E2 [Rugosibacter sp.]